MLENMVPCTILPISIFLVCIIQIQDSPCIYQNIEYGHCINLLILRICISFHFTNWSSPFPLPSILKVQCSGSATSEVVRCTVAHFTILHLWPTSGRRHLFPSILSSKLKTDDDLYMISSLVLYFIWFHSRINWLASPETLIIVWLCYNNTSSSQEASVLRQSPRIL